MQVELLVVIVSYFPCDRKEQPWRETIVKIVRPRLTGSQWKMPHKHVTWFVFQCVHMSNNFKQSLQQKDSEIPMVNTSVIEQYQCH